MKTVFVLLIASVSISARAGLIRDEGLLDSQYASMGTLSSVLQKLGPTMTQEDRRFLVEWSTNVVAKNHRAMMNLASFWQNVNATFSQEERISLLRWAESQITLHQTQLNSYPDILKVVLEGSVISDSDIQKTVEWLFRLDLVDTVDDYGTDVSLSYFEVVYQSLLCLGASLTQAQGVALIERMKVLSERHPADLPNLMHPVMRSVTLTNAEKISLLVWAEGFYKKHIGEYCAYDTVVSLLSPSLSETEKREHLLWAMNMTTNVLARHAEKWTDSTKVDVTTTNVVIHYVKQQQECTVDPIPSDSAFVAIVTEIDGNATGIPNSWATNFPSFTEKFGGDFVKAVTKPTGKIGNGNVPLMVWQDYVAGTDPTDVSSRFSASINYVGGHVEINWTPVVADRSYKVYGMKKLIDAEWVECSEDTYDEYNFFKVKVSCQK